ncbi:hypothetical protein ABGT24_19115 [Peribacillus frigoritolerans]
MLKTKLIETGVPGLASKGDPTGAKAPRVDRPRKASACSGNQR